MSEFICLKCSKFRKCLLETTIKGTESECEFIDRASRLEDDGTLCDEAEDEIGIRPLNLNFDHKSYPEVEDLDDYGEPKNDYRDQINEICESKNLRVIKEYNEIKNMRHDDFDAARRKIVCSSMFFGIKKKDIAETLGMTVRWLNKIMKIR